MSTYSLYQYLLPQIVANVSIYLLLPLLLLAAFLNYARKSHGMQRVQDVARRTMSSMSWPRCCHFPQPSPAS